MGWLFKGFLALVALSLLGAGLWWASAVIFVYLVLSSRTGRKKAERTVFVTQPAGYADGGSSGGGGPEVERGRRGRGLGIEWRWRYLLGGLFLVAAFVAVGEHGTFSPLVFGGLGALCFLWAPLSRIGHVPATGYSPLRESTLLRGVLLPFEWATVVELKLSSQESARALSVLHDDLVVVAPPSEGASAYLVVKVMALGYRGAEGRMAERLRKLAGLMANRGVYLMPLDSLEAARRFQPGLEPLKMDLSRDTVLEAVGHYPYEVLVVKPDGGRAKSLGAYLVSRSSREEVAEGAVPGPTQPTKGAAVASRMGRVVFPPTRQSFERPPLLWEVISCLQERFRFSEPDGHTMFLNSMHLSRAVSPGHKMKLASGAAGERPDGSTLTVESLGGAPVEMTRAQLRMVVRMYD